MRTLLTAAVLVGALTPGVGAAMDLNLTGAVATSLSASDLPTGAGSAPSPSWESGAAAVVLDVTGTAGAADAWRIDVRRTGAAWAPGTRVWVRRTGPGTGEGAVSGGTAWVEVTGLDAALVEGAGDRTGLPVQVRVTGLSLAMTPDVYAAALTYTLVDTP